MKTQYTASRAYVLLYGITLAFRMATALPLTQAGYMDASYAMHVAESLARGRGFTDEVLWNYLNQPIALPHPSNLYWMPLQSVLIAPLFVLFGTSYRVAQIPFVLLSSLLPLVSFHLARKVFGRDDYAWAAGIFTGFSGFYTVYWVSPDSFTTFALFGSLCLYLAARGLETDRARYFLGAGVLAALAHLSRADGILLVAIPPLALLVQKTRDLRRVLLLSSYCFLAYFLVMLPWFARNYYVVGTLLPTAGTKTLWLLDYDEIFRYADDLSPDRYLASGFVSILSSKALAAVRSLFIIAFGALQIYLVPFALVGLWQLRRRIEFLPFLLYFVLFYSAMTLAFTHPSWRGTVLHSTTALVPFLSVAVPQGVASSIAWIARRRGTWNVDQASRFFLAGFAALAILLSVYLYEEGVFGLINRGTGDIPLWNQRDAHYGDVSRWLDENTRGEYVVMVVDPPAFYNVSRRRAIMIPTDEDTNAIFLAARKFTAGYLLLEFDHPRPLRELYRQHQSLDGLIRVAEFRDARERPVFLFQVQP